MEILLLKGAQNTNSNANNLDYTFSFDGELYSVLKDKFDPNFFTIERLAKSLSKLSRYNGHIGDEFQFYSVAQHSVLMANFFLLSGNLELAKQAMLHDAIEAVVFGDIPTPTKKLIKQQYNEIVDPLEEALLKHYNIKFPLDPKIKQIDRNIAQVEMTIGLKEKKNFEYWDMHIAYKKFINMWETIIEMEKYQELEAISY